ncbi:MAG: hypothetical protein IT330_11290 [Anaerolineae bacterium]|nr:hypothetical protein [Anaerolineae bacterium]
MQFRTIAERIAAALSGIPGHWDGREAIQEMRRDGFPHWRQMEWIGFYFQFLCGRCLSSMMQIPGPRYGRPEFDGLLEIPWDFKAHAMNTSSHQIIVNDSGAISGAISDYGYVGLVLAMGKVEYNDENRTFQEWHSVLKGGPSDYEKERVRRGAWSRLRKVSFDLQQISFIKITDATLVKTGSFQSDFRNSNGRPRRSKVLLDLEKIDEEIVYFIEF